MIGRLLCRMGFHDTRLLWWGGPWVGWVETSGVCRRRCGEFFKEEK